MVFSLGESRPVFTPSSPTLALASNIYTCLTYGMPPPRFYFPNHIPKPRTLILDIHALFPHIWYSNTIITFKTDLYPWQYHQYILPDIFSFS